MLLELCPYTEGQKIRNCERHGAELPKDARFCPTCGTGVGGVEREELSVSADDLVGKVKELFRARPRFNC